MGQLMAVDGMKHYAAMSDPAANPNFRRRWSEPPRVDSFKSIGVVAATVAENTGRQAIAHHLTQAAALQGPEATVAFEIADNIRSMMGLTWDEVVGLRTAA